MNPQRISVKYFIENPAAVDLEEYIPIFQRWIKEQTVEGLLIDVADYKHVQAGPGIILIGQQTDYALDVGGGRPGLLYRRKRKLGGGLVDQLRTVFRLALQACLAVQAEPVLQGRVTFRTDRAELTFADRLSAPNEAQTLEIFRGDIETLTSDLYAGLDVALKRQKAESRQPFTIQINASGAPDLDVLLDRLGAALPDAATAGV